MRSAATGSDEAGFCPAIGCHQRRQKAWPRVLLRAARRDGSGAWIGGKLHSKNRFLVSHASPSKGRQGWRGVVDLTILVYVLKVVQPMGEGRE